MMDDVLDYRIDNDTIDKQVLDDWRSGTPTLPLLLAIKNRPDLTEEFEQSFGQTDCPKHLFSVLSSQITQIEALIQQQLKEAPLCLETPPEHLIQGCQWLASRLY